MTLVFYGVLLFGAVSFAVTLGRKYGPSIKKWLIGNIQ